LWRVVAPLSVRIGLADRRLVMGSVRIAQSLGVCALVVIGCLMSAAAPIDGRFSYQARLTSGGVPITGVVDARFSLWDAAAAGAQIGANTEFLSQAVSDGVYNANLDFGVAALNGDMRWLQVEVRSPAGVGGYVVLGRREILGAPYAIQTRGIFVDENNNVGIGTSTPLFPLSVESDGSYASIYSIATGLTGIAGHFKCEGEGGVAVIGASYATTGPAYGGQFGTQSTAGRGVSGVAVADIGPTSAGHFDNFSTQGYGVWARAAAFTGLNYGGFFESRSTSGRGVYGIVAAATGQTYGGYFQSDSTSGLGVYGKAAASTGNAYGGYFESASDTGRGVYGKTNASTGQSFGGYFESASISGRGVYGWATASGGFTDGVYGRSDSTAGRGIDGWATASTGTTYGVVGQSDSTSGRGVYGFAAGASGTTYGGYFQSDSSTGRGVYSLADAISGINYGGWFETNSTSGRALFGLADASSGINYGVVGHSNSSSGYDFWASGAGTNYGAPSSRRFKSNVVPIDDPLDKLATLRGVYFDWDEEHGGQHDVGMIAEEVGAVMPEIVNYEENGVDAIGMDYSKMTPLLVEAVNALRAEKDEQLDTLRAENRAMRGDNDELRAKLESLENRIDAMASPQQDKN